MAKQTPAGSRGSELCWEAIVCWGGQLEAKALSVVALCWVGKRGIPFTGLYSSIWLYS